MRRSVAAAVLWSALACWAGGILWLSSLGPQELPEAAFVFSDKFNHFAAFAVGGWLAASALRLARPSRPLPASLVVAVLVVAAFGAFDEMLQTFTPGRKGAELYDWIADFLGAAGGALLTLATHARLERFVTRR